jgi:hypothetical protein
MIPDLLGKGEKTLYIGYLARRRRKIFLERIMRTSNCLMLFLNSFCFMAILGCGNNSSTANPQPVGADIIQSYNLHIEGHAVTTSLDLPQQFTDGDWGLKQDLCQEAGFDLVPYAGQTVSSIRYSLMEKYYSANVFVLPGEPLYLWVIAKDRRSVCGYLSVREGSALIPGVFAVNDPNLWKPPAPPASADPWFGSAGNVLISGRGTDTNSNVNFIWVGFNSPDNWQGFLSLHGSIPNSGWIGGRVVVDAKNPLGFYFDPDTTFSAEITAEEMQTALFDIGQNPGQYAGRDWVVLPIAEAVR